MSREYKKLPKAFKTKWVKALRSGKYKQAEGILCEKFGENDFGYCCLGVACAITSTKANNHLKNKADRLGFIESLEKNFKGLALSKKLPKQLIGDSSNLLVEELSSMNDAGESFEAIADWIEKNL